MPANKGQYKIEIVADSSQAEKAIGDFEQTVTNSQFKSKKAAEETAKYTTNQTAKTVKEEKKLYKSLTKALKAEHNAQMKDTKGHLGKEAAEHKRHLKMMEKAEQAHAERTETIRKRTAGGRARGKIAGIGKAAKAGAMGGGAGGAIAGALGAAGPVGMAAAAGIGLVTAAFSKANVEARKFNDSALKVKTLLSDADAEKLPGAMEQLRAIARETGASLTDDLAPALYNIISATPSLGSNLGAAADLAGKAAAAGTALGATTNEVAQATSNLANAMNLSLESTENQDFIMDTLANTMKQGVIPSGQALAQNIAKVAPGMAALADNAQHGVKALGAMTAALTANGVSVDESQTQMKALVAELLDSGKATKVAALGLKGFDAETKKITDWSAFMKDASGNMGELMKVMTSQESQNAIRILAKNGGEGFSDLMTSMDNAGGTAQRMAATMADSGEIANKRLSATWDDLFITLGETTSSQMTSIKSAMADGLGFIAEMFKSSATKAAEAQADFLGLTDQLTGLTDSSKVAAEALRVLVEAPGVGEVSESDIAILRDQAIALKDEMPGLSAEMLALLDQPGGMTAEALTQVNGLLTEATERTKLFALAASEESAAASLEAVNDQLSELAETSAWAGAAAGFKTMGPMGAAYGAVIGSFIKDTGGALTVQQQVADETQAAMDELKVAMKDATAAKDTEGLADMRREMRELQAQNDTANRNEMQINEVLKKQVEEQFAAAKKNADLFDRELDIKETMIGIEEDLGAKMGANEDMQGAIRDIAADIVFQENERLATAVELTEEKEKEFTLGTETLSVADSMAASAAKLGVTTKDANADKLIALEAEELAQKQVLDAMRLQLVALKGQVTGEKTRAEALEVVKDQEIQIQKIKAGEKVEVTAAKDIDTSDMGKAASQLEGEIAKMEKVAAATTATRVELEGKIAKKQQESAKKVESTKDKSASKRIKAAERSTKRNEKVKDKSQKDRLSKEQQEHKKRVDDMNKRLAQRALEMAKADAEAKKKSDENFAKFHDSLIATTDQLKGLGSAVLFSVFDEQIAPALQGMANIKVTPEMEGVEKAIGIALNKGLKGATMKSLAPSIAGLMQDAAKIFRSKGGLDPAGGTGTFEMGVSKEGGGSATKTINTLAELEVEFKKLLKHQLEIANSGEKQVHIHTNLRRLMGQIANAAVSRGITEEKIKVTIMDQLAAEMRMLEHRKKMGEFELDHEQFTEGDLKYLKEKIKIQEKIVAEEREAAGIQGDMSQTLVAEVRELQAKKEELKKINAILKKGGYDQTESAIKAHEEAKAQAGVASGYDATIKLRNIREADLLKIWTKRKKIGKAMDTESKSMMKDAGVIGDGKKHYNDLLEHEKSLKNEIELLGITAEKADQTKQRMQNQADVSIGKEQAIRDKFVKETTRRGILVAEIRQDSEATTEDGKVSVGIAEKLLTAEEQLHALRKEQTLTQESAFRSLREELRGIETSYESINEELDAERTKHQENNTLLVTRARLRELERGRLQSDLAVAETTLAANKDDAAAQKTVSDIKDKIRKKSITIAEDTELIRRETERWQQTLDEINERQFNEILDKINSVVSSVESVGNTAFSIFDAAMEGTNEAAKAAMGSVAGLATELTGLPFDKVFGVLTGIGERMNTWLKSNGKAAKAARRALELAEERLEIKIHEIELLRMQLEMEGKLNAVYVSRTDEASESLDMLGKEMAINEEAVESLSESFERLRDIAKDRRDKGFMRDDLDKRYDAIQKEIGAMESLVSLADSMESLDMSDAAEVSDTLAEMNEMMIEGTLVLTKAEQEAFDAMQAHLENQLGLLSKQAAIERGLFGDRQDELEHEKAMDRFQGTELDFLLEKLKIQDDLFKLAEEQFANELITLDEFRAIELERFELEKEILALKEEESGLDEEALNRLREMNMERQRLILSGGDKSRVAELEARIIQEMRDAGSSEDAILAALAGFANASYAVGTASVPRTGLAMVHEGERIIPTLENDQMMGLLRNQSASLNAVQEVMSTFMATREMAGSNISNSTTSSNSTIIESVVINLPSTISDPQEAAEATLRILEDRGVWNNR